MGSGSDQSSRAASIVRTLCGAEGSDITFRFSDPIRVPAEKYDGRSYETETLGKATLNATIQRAEDGGLEGVLMCNAKIEMDELDRVGIDPSAIGSTRPRDGETEYCVVEVRASRDWTDEPDASKEEVEKAIEEGRQEDVLPPWDGLPTVVVKVARTSECLQRSYESNYHVQYDPPTHEIGEVIDVRVK